MQRGDEQTGWMCSRSANDGSPRSSSTRVEEEWWSFPKQTFPALSPAAGRLKMANKRKLVLQMRRFGEDVRGRWWHTKAPGQAGRSAFPTCLSHRLFPQSSWFVSAALMKIERGQKCVSAVLVFECRCCWWACAWPSSAEGSDSEGFPILNFLQCDDYIAGNKQTCDIFPKVNSVALTLCLWKYPGKLSASSSLIAFKSKWVGAIAQTNSSFSLVNMWVTPTNNLYRQKVTDAHARWNWRFSNMSKTRFRDIRWGWGHGPGMPKELRLLGDFNALCWPGVEPAVVDLGGTQMEPGWRDSRGLCSP